jgi:hypothetical protein
MPWMQVKTSKFALPETVKQMIEVPSTLGYPLGPDVNFAANPNNPDIDEDISLTCYGAVLGQRKAVQKQLSLHEDILKEKDFHPTTVAWMDGDRAKKQRWYPQCLGKFNF